MDAARMLLPTLWRGIAVLCLAGLAATMPAMGQSKNLAPGFTNLPAGQKIVLMPVDVELFSISAGGVTEPRADWTTAAQQHMNRELAARLKARQLELVAVEERAADEFADQVALHAAVARAIELHHGFGGVWALPSKQGRLDWSFDDAMQPLQRRFGARYGLFVRVRDSYASGERKAAMVALALLGVGLAGGYQSGYASLVDLETGRVLWFNRLGRPSGDLREPAAAAASVDVLLEQFPATQ